MARHTAEEKAQAVAEYWLLGSFRFVARKLDVPDHKSIAAWVAQADAPQTSPHKRLRKRALELYESRAATLEEAFNRALQLQMEDLPDADFRDRTGFLKIVGEQIQLAKGKPTQIVGHHERLDDEIEKFLAQFPGVEASNGHHHD